jgi:hypothetical protein
MQRMTALLAMPVAVALLACGYSREDRHHHDVDDGVPVEEETTEVAQASIDADATMEVEPGVGVGVFVEYASGGTWRIYASCDTNVSGYRCDWDVLVTPLEGGLEFLGEEGLEAGDLVADVDGSLNLIATNTHDFDGFLFAAEPGATVRVDVYLDGVPSPRYVYWVGDGAVHRGAPTNPIDLAPSSP